MAKCLEQLEGYDPTRVLRVTGINKLGAEGTTVLREYLESKYGPVEEVLLANSPDARSVMGFVLMFTADDVASVLAHGESHEVQENAAVKLRAFERRQRDKAEDKDKGNNDMQDGSRAEHEANDKADGETT